MALFPAYSLLTNKNGDKLDDAGKNHLIHIYLEK